MHLTEIIDEIITTIRTQVKDFNDALFGTYLQQIRALGEEAIPLLRPYLNDERATVRDFVRDALTALQDTSMIPELLTFMTSPEESDRLGAALCVVEYDKAQLLSAEQRETYVLLLRAMLNLSSNFQDRLRAVICLGTVVDDDTRRLIFLAHLPFESHASVRNNMLHRMRPDTS